MAGSSRPGDFLGLLVDLSARFVNVAPEGVDGEILDAQRRVCDCLEFDLSTLWQTGEGWPSDFRLTHFYRAGPGPRPPDPMMARDHFPWAVEQLQAGRVLAIRSVDELPAEASLDRESRARFAVRSSINLPLSTGGGPPVGVVSFATTCAERDWPAPLVQRLQLVAQIFANALARKRSDEALRQSEERLTNAIEAAGVGLWSLDLGTGHFWLSPRMQALLLGTPADQLTYPAFLEMVHPEDRDAVRRAVAAAWESEKPLAVDYRLPMPGGALRWISARGRRHVDRSGRPDRLTGASSDITDRVRSAEALAESETKFRATFEQAAVGIAHLSLDGSFLRVNRRFGEIVEYEPEELIGRCVEEITFRDPAHPHSDERMAVLRRGEADSYTTEQRYVRKSGEPVWVNVTVSLARGENGVPGWFVKVVEEISERKQAEEELNQFRSQLWHADRAAQIGVITASLAHELNQPLAAILTNAQAGLRFLASAEPDLREIREILADIVADDKRAGSVVSGLRAMLRRRETLREGVRLVESIQDVLELLHSEMLARRVQPALRQEYDPTVIADRTQIQQVLLNLSMNALDAMSHQSQPRRIDFFVSRYVPGQSLVSVRDSGPGVDNEQRSRLFEPFWTTKDSGMGIGLAISRSIIESHGGQMWFRNNDTRGATFYFTLPTKEPELPASRPETILGQ